MTGVTRIRPVRRLTTAVVAGLATRAALRRLDIDRVDLKEADRGSDAPDAYRRAVHEQSASGLPGLVEPVRARSGVVAGKSPPAAWAQGDVPVAGADGSSHNTAAGEGAPKATAPAEPEAEPWIRQNYRGRQVDVRGGLALATGLLAAAARSAPRGDPGPGWGAVAAVGAATAAGWADDMAADATARGLRGHL
ncbi:MAG: hypothetical protein LBO20_01765, partial [Bifidobacteriaceae bacterium]|nr:hypothetical protein [Bifidobacteriaceae bacterium]